MPTFKLAIDRSARHIDADGRLHVASSHISKAAINPYYGQEIPGFVGLGLEPDKIYRLLRDPVELERAAESFARLPILSKHVPKPMTVDGVVDDPELKKLIIGAIGSEVKFNDPYLDADLCFWDSKAIAGIETESVIELSCGYRYVPVMEPGEYKGQPYDGIMTQIKGNHLALVEVGRAGSDVVVADHNPFKNKDTDMKKTRLGRALLAALCAASPVLAADSALPALVGAATRKTFNRKGVKSQLLALDADLDAEQVDELIDAIIGVEDDPKPGDIEQSAADESPVEKIRTMLTEAGVSEDTIDAVCALIHEAGASDADPDDSGVKKEEMEAALDSLSKKLRAQFKDADEARANVRSVVGDVMGMDSAEDVYGFALDHLKVDRKGVTGIPALRALFKAASNSATSAPVQIAQDSAGLASRFPNATRFGK